MAITTVEEDDDDEKVLNSFLLFSTFSQYAVRIKQHAIRDNWLCFFKITIYHQGTKTQSSRDNGFVFSNSYPQNAVHCTQYEQIGFVFSKWFLSTQIPMA